MLISKRSLVFLACLLMLAFPPAAIANDTDGDRIIDLFETDTTTFVSPTDTGTDPLLPDTDGDGFIDGAEVAGLSDPNDGTQQPAVPELVQLTGSLNPLDPQAFDAASHLAWGDLDADGDLDLVIGNVEGEFLYFENTGSRFSLELTERTSSTTPANPLAAEDVGFFAAPALGDIDGDGDLDMIVGEGGLEDAFYFENTGTVTVPAFTQRTGLITPTNPLGNPFVGAGVRGRVLRPAFGDLDADGDLDLLIGEESGTFRYFENIGSPTVPSYTAFPSNGNPLAGEQIESPQGSPQSTPAFGDYDGDGDLDVFSGGAPGAFVYFENTGTATTPAFTRRSDTSTPPNPLAGEDIGNFSSPSFADLDGDGDLDVATAGLIQMPQQLILYEAVPPGTLADGFGPPEAFVVDDFSDPTGGGTGWVTGSNWGGNVDYVATNPTDPNGLLHVRSKNVPNAFRTLSTGAANAIAASDEVWLGFRARFDRAKDLNQYAGVSFYSAGSEVFYVGGAFFSTEWGTVYGTGGEIPSSDKTVSEWSHVLVRFDFGGGGGVDFYLDGRLASVRADLPARAWDQMRIGNGFGVDNRIYVENLRVGSSREAVESPLPPLLYSARFGSYREHNHGKGRTTSSPLYGPLNTFTTTDGETLGIATDGNRVFTAHPTPGIVVTRDLNGNELNSWPAFPSLQSMTTIGGQVAVGSDEGITVYDADTGNVIRTLPDPCPSGLAPTGLAFDGIQMWGMCDAEILAIDPITGLTSAAIPNPAFQNPFGCPLGPQQAGLAATAPGELTVGCDDGGLGVSGGGFRINTSTGQAIDSTGVGLGSGLAAIPAIALPEPGFGVATLSALVLFGSLARRRKRNVHGCEV